MIKKSINDDLNKNIWNVFCNYNMIYIVNINMLKYAKISQLIIQFITEIISKFITFINLNYQNLFKDIYE